MTAMPRFPGSPRSARVGDGVRRFALLWFGLGFVAVAALAGVLGLI